MPKISAGILFYRIQKHEVEVLLVHPGGPFWKNKDAGAWTIPKGEIEKDEDPLQAAKREVSEETGITISTELLELTPVKQKSGKIIHAWATKTDFDTSSFKSNQFEMEWPPHSRIRKKFPEIDKAGWFSIAEAKKKINKGQIPLIEELIVIIAKF